ncbi:MAG: hypothetical protein ABS938_12400 [Psychrobacillus psychrodurans]
MAYDIPKELEVGKEYTEYEILKFITNNKNVVISGNESNYFNGSNDKKYKIVQAYENFSHRIDPQSGAYLIPTSKTKFYRIEKV